MSRYPDYISEKRRPVPAPKSIVENGQAHFGTFDKPFEKLNLLDCEKPCGKFMPDFMKKSRLTEWEAFEVHLDEGALVSAVYNTGPLGFSIFVWFDKRSGKISSWRNIVPVKKAKVASQLVNDYCELKVKKSEYVIKNDLMNGKASAKGWSEGKCGRIEIDLSVERLSPPSNVSIPFGPNKPLYSEKDFFKAEGYITVNGEKFLTNENSVSIIDDHKGYYPYRAHYDWLTTMGRCDIDGEKKYFAFNLTRNQAARHIRAREPQGGHMAHTRRTRLRGHPLRAHEHFLHANALYRHRRLLCPALRQDLRLCQGYERQKIRRGRHARHRRGQVDQNVTRPFRADKTQGRSFNGASFHAQPNAESIASRHLQTISPGNRYCKA